MSYWLYLALGEPQVHEPQVAKKPAPAPGEQPVNKPAAKRSAKKKEKR